MGSVNYTSGCLDWNATADEFKTSLQDLDNIENVTSYSDIKNEIIKFVSASQYKTLEKLITDLKKQLDDKFPIQIEKLEINKIEIAKKYNAKKVSVSI